MSIPLDQQVPTARCATCEHTGNFAGRCPQCECTDIDYGLDERSVFANVASSRMLREQTLNDMEWNSIHISRKY